MEELLEKKLRAFVELKYPSRSKNGIRSVEYKDDFAEVMFGGGETLYFSSTFINELKENT